MAFPTLPISEILPALKQVMARGGICVLEAPPGAGKTTLVPLALCDDLPPGQKMILLEPRRLAARAAAERMADLLGETVGGRVGYRIRGETKVSKETQIEVVTEGILTRMIQHDAALSGVGLVIFDEFHERSLNADLGLALVSEVRAALRDDLRVLVMSATLDAAPIAKMLSAPILRSEGRAFPVETRWLETPLRKEVRFENAAADLIAEAVTATEGGVLVFLPGEGEIRRVAGLIDKKLPDDCVITPLYGALPFAAQRKAIRPAPEGRKIVLSTAIAETSLTIEDIRVVVDCGKARRARYNPGNGMSRLVTEPVSRAEATQRQGRAGRVAAGICYRMWTRGQDGALPAFAPPEIETADLAGLALELALWGVTAVDDLVMLSPPNAGVLSEARTLLGSLGALDPSGRITEHGRKVAALPTHPRLAHMLIKAGKQAAPLAALIAERDIALRGAPLDLDLRLRALNTPKDSPLPVNRGALETVRQEAKRLARLVPDSSQVLSPGAMAALAYPDRIGLRRKGDQARFVLSGGSGVMMDDADPMANQRLIVAVESDGAARDARLRRALPLTEAELRATFAAEITWRESCDWDKRTGQISARRRECFGALILSDQHWRDPPEEMRSQAAIEGLRQLGLPKSKATSRLIARLRLMRGADWPDMSDTALLAEAEDWLAPYLGQVRNAADLKTLDLHDALLARLSWDQQQRLDQLTPAYFTSPLGNRIAIDYGAAEPTISLRLQEVFGLDEHPTLGTERRPLRLELLSPAQRPVQVTTDLPGFWRSSYADVRKDMRGRYPKHPWPEDPTRADPTLRTKPRKG